jgi:hypothetical protein
MKVKKQLQLQLRGCSSIFLVVHVGSRERHVEERSRWRLHELKKKRERKEEMK